MTFRNTILTWLVLSCLSLGGWSRIAIGQQVIAYSQDPRQKLVLSIEDAINLALRNNLDISIEQFNPEIKKEDIVNAEAAFDSEADGSFYQTFNESESVATPVGVSALDFGLGKRFLYGGSYQLGWASDLAAFNGTTVDSETGGDVDIENQYENSLSVSYQQPILKNFGTDINMTGINIARKNRDTSVSELRSTVISVVTDVKTTYWDLVNAIADLEAKRVALQLAEDLVKINEAQVNVGTLAPIEVLQAKTQAASRSVDVTTAELTVQNIEDQLKRLLNFAQDDPVWQAAIAATDAPTEERQNLSLEESIEIALENREELKQLQQGIDIQELSLNYSENQMKPDVNLVGAMGMTGTNTAFGESLVGVADFKNFDVTLGANFSYPIGNRAAKSTYNQTKLELDKTRLSYRNLEQLLTVEVRVIHRNAVTAYNLIGSTRIARQLAEEQLDAEQKKFNEGLSTNFQVLDYQDKLTQARTREALAITAYNQSLTNLDKAIGYTLQRHNIIIEE
ncbi:MAG: TolC family protein [bacterium]|nr:TolC family protein [bacterium]